MRGGLGNDTYVVDNSGDFVFEAAGAGIDRIFSFISLSLNGPATAAVENLSLVGVAINGTGNALGNSIAGNNSNNILSGLGGNDFLLGLRGSDRLFGGPGNDLLNGGPGGDLLNGGGAGAGSDAFRFSTALSVPSTSFRTSAISPSATMTSFSSTTTGSSAWVRSAFSRRQPSRTARWQ